VDDPIWICEADVVELLDLNEAIDALERGLRREADGNALNMVKTHAAWGHNNLHAIGAVFPGEGLAATKTWAHTQRGATPLLIVIDAEDGSLKAIIEAFALGQMRTGGMSGVATNWLADRQADDMAIIGTGKQALMQVAAVAAVRPLKRLRVFSPRPPSRAQFIDKLRADFAFEIVDAASVEAATRDAPIVTVVTRATAPFLSSAMVARGAHVNAVGAITPERAELAPDVVARAGVIAVDSVPAVQRLSAEFIDRFGPPGIAWDAVTPLCQLIARGNKRQATDDLTLFKAMGVGISDLSLGSVIHARARASGKGRSFAQPVRAKPRIRPAQAPVHP
jgi:ornithine cyclodeaminase/alanine dehydrogenase-like protein (mu-crystallin family)